VGLNLQHAATVINMDQPWNPAVLEQRIGRVHRLGQRRSVQVVNFIAQGTIEESMLSLLGFKKALFAGVLDGGASDVSLGGSRLARFMEGVEKATGGVGRPPIQAPAAPEPAMSITETRTRRRPMDEIATPARGPAAAGEGANDAWRQLIDAGSKIFAQLLAAQAPAAGKLAGDEHPLLETDSATGRRYLRLPMPDPDTLAKLAEAVAGLLPRSTVK
jgi:hypothetical protein